MALIDRAVAEVCTRLVNLPVQEAPVRSPAVPSLWMVAASKMNSMSCSRILSASFVIMAALFPR